MLFNPTCEHCQEEAYIIEQNIDKFKKTKILFMAASGMENYMEFFRNTTKHSQYPKIIVGLDSANYIDDVYMYTSLPQINIYDKNRQLIKVFNGEVAFDALEEFIE